MHPKVSGPAVAIAVARELDRVMRSDRGRLLALLASGLRDLALAEDVLQEAAVSALTHWARTGLPASPQGWLLQVARRKAIDRLRGSHRDALKSEALSRLAIEEALPDQPEIPDERLRLIFACCHPALEMKSRIALTLRTVCGLTTAEIARAFLDAEPAMGQRLSRAKAKIAAAGIPFSIPEREQWQGRLEAVLATVYLIFTTGYVAGPDEPRDLCLEAEFLVRMIDGLRPGDAEIEGALAMVLLTSARRGARIGRDGASLPPGDQDRELWDSARLQEGREILKRAVERRQPGAFQIKAAIADCQMASPGPDWPQITALYQALWRFEPTPIVALNGAVALAETGDAPQALAIVEALAATLKDYPPWFAARAALLAMNGRLEEAVPAYHQALSRAEGEAEKLFLQGRLDGLACSRS